MLAVNTGGGAGKREVGGWLGPILHLSWAPSQTARPGDARGENNHTAQHSKSRPDEKKINVSALVARDAIKAEDELHRLRLEGGSLFRSLLLSIRRQMPLLKEPRRDLNKLKNLPGESPRREKEL